MTLAILILGLVIATCIIAYLADNLGKNLGKKRISLLGLRPRQTATLISMISSVGVMLLTVGLLLLTSSSVRNSLLRYDAEKRQANELRREKDALRSEKETLLKTAQVQRGRIEDQLEEIALNRKRTAQFLKQREQTEAQLKEAKARLNTALKGEKTARARVAEAQKRLASAQKQFEKFRAQLATAQSETLKAQSQTKKAQTELQKEQERVAQTRNELQAARTNVEAAQKDLENARTELKTAQQEQATAREELARAQNQLEQTQKNYRLVQNEVNKTLKQLQRAVSDIEELRARRNELQGELDRKNNELLSLQNEVEKYQSIAGRLAIGDVSVMLGEVFAEESIRLGTTTREARETLRTLMAEGRRQLSNPKRTLHLVLPATAANLSESEFLDGFAVYLSTLGAPVSVRLSAVRDHAGSETEIYARLLPIIVRTIFEKGEVLVSATIDGNSSDARIFNQLLTLLNENEQRTRERGVMPLLSPESPFFYAPGTNERVFEALRAIQAAGGPVQVRLIAAEKITSIESPRVQFEILEEKSTSASDSKSTSQSASESTFHRTSQNSSKSTLRG